MATTQRWNPFMRDFVTLRDAVDRLFEDSIVAPDRLLSSATRGQRPMAVEICETPDELVVRALVPGVTPENLDVEYHEGTLSLRARTETPAAHDDWTWHVREFGYGEMARVISLPKQIDVERAQAMFRDGILTLHLPKAASAKPRHIKVVSADASVDQRSIASGEQPAPAGSAS
jgi:HSP20 family protein